MSMNAITFVSVCLLFLAEQEAIMNDKISTNNMVVILTREGIFNVVQLVVTFVSRLPKPNDSSDYCDRLIYLSCNNYLTFHVLKTSFNEIMPQLLRFTRKRRRAFWLVLLAKHEEIRVYVLQ